MPTLTSLPRLARAAARALALAALMMLAALAAPARAQAPAATGGSPDSTLARVDRIFARYATRESPGCAVGVARDGRVVLERGYGMANLEHDVPITPRTLFESGSVAKQFTASTIVLLAMEGKLSLDDDARKYVPELPDYGTTITIRHLLSHTSGLRDWFTLAELGGRPAYLYHWTNDAVLELATRQKALNFPPGSEYSYSNTGYVVLTTIAARVSGTPLAELARTRLFEPLGMTSTRFRDDWNRVAKGRATAYAPLPAGGWRTDMPFMSAHGSGGMLTTVGDLLKWNESLAGGTLAGRALADSLESRARLTSGRRIPYALGLSVGEYRGTREISHSGTTAGYQTFLARWPERKLSVALLCNAGDAATSMLVHAVADLFLTGLPLPAAAPRYASGASMDSAATRGLEGPWFSEARRELVRLRVREGVPRLDAPAELRFDTVAGERVMRRVTSAGDTTLFRRLAARDREPLDDFVGEYANDETDARWTITRAGDALRVRTRAGEIVPTVVAADYVQMGSLGVVRFTRGAGGRVDGLELYAGRVRSLRFAKQR